MTRPFAYSLSSSLLQSKPLLAAREVAGRVILAWTDVGDHGLKLDLGRAMPDAGLRP